MELIATRDAKDPFMSWQQSINPFIGTSFSYSCLVPRHLGIHISLPCLKVRGKRTLNAQLTCGNEPLCVRNRVT